VGLQSGKAMGVVSASAETLARTLSRSMQMTHYKILAKTAMAMGSLLVAAGWIHEISAASQPPQGKITTQDVLKDKSAETKRPQAGFTPVDDPANDPKRHKDYLLAIVGNMRPL